MGSEALRDILKIVNYTAEGISYDTDESMH